MAFEGRFLAGGFAGNCFLKVVEFVVPCWLFGGGFLISGFDSLCHSEIQWFCHLVSLRLFG